MGIAGAVLSSAATRDLLARTARRLDAQARAALPVYAEGTAARGRRWSPSSCRRWRSSWPRFFAWLLAGGRRREGEKYAGLRILR